MWDRQLPTTLVSRTPRFMSHCFPVATPRVRLPSSPTHSFVVTTTPRANQRLHPNPPYHNPPSAHRVASRRVASRRNCCPPPHLPPPFFQVPMRGQVAVRCCDTLHARGEGAGGGWQPRVCASGGDCGRRSGCEVTSNTFVEGYSD